MGRRFGKTTFFIERTMRKAIDGIPCAYFVPTYKMLTEVWRDIRFRLLPVTKRCDSSEHRLELITGGIVDMWSFEAVDSARGRKYGHAVGDEAAFAPNLEEAMNRVIMPSLTDLGGELWLGSTPRGRNHFHTVYQQALDNPHWARFHAPTIANPYIKPEEVEIIRQQISDLDYRQEYLAEFLEHEGLVFKGVTAAATAEFQDKPIPGRTYVAGGDWGFVNDYTVISVMDVQDRKQVDQIRFTNKDFDEQISRVVALNKKWGLSCLLGEDNSLGKAFNDRLRSLGVPIQPFHTTSGTKHELIQKLALDIELGNLLILNEPVQISELMAYEAERLPSGVIRYGAPEGMHDDCVISCALMNLAGSKAVKRSITTTSFYD